MAIVAQVNNSTNVLHVVRDITGAVYTGTVSALTVTLLDPSQNDSSASATWTQPFTGGYVNIAVTPDETGNWLLGVTNPAGTDEATSYYTVQTVTSTAGLTPSGTYLTTLNNLKQQLGISTTDTGSSTGDPYSDDYLNNLIARASTLIETRLGRSVVQATYTEYVDGGGEYLFLRQGPIISVTGVASVDDWTAGVATTTSVANDTYIYESYTTHDPDAKLPGAIRALSWKWVSGQKNYEVIYGAGWASVPYDLEQLCLDVCVFLKNLRKDAGTTSRDIGSGGIPFKTWPELYEYVDQALTPYKAVRL